MNENTNNIEKQSSAKKFLQFLKFAAFSCSAGVIQVGSFTLLNEVVMETVFMQNLTAQHELFSRIMSNEYGPCYLIALLLSVIWNFTFNRKFTFKSAANVPVAMLKILAYYAVFTPISVIIGNYFTSKYANFAPIEYIVLGITMLCNMITEFLVSKFFVYKDQENTAVKEDK